GGAIPRARPEALGRCELPLEEVQPPDRVLPARVALEVRTQARPFPAARQALPLVRLHARRGRPRFPSLPAGARERLVQRSPPPLSQDTSSVSSGSVAAPSSSSRCASERVPTAARTRTGWLST